MERKSWCENSVDQKASWYKEPRGSLVDQRVSWSWSQKTRELTSDYFYTRFARFDSFELFDSFDSNDSVLTWYWLVFDSFEWFDLFDSFDSFDLVLTRYWLGFNSFLTLLSGLTCLTRLTHFARFLKRHEGAPKGRPSKASLIFLSCWLFSSQRLYHFFGQRFI